MANNPPLAFVRYINAVPDTLNTTVRFIDQIAFTPQTFVNVPFRGQGQGGYQGTEAKARKFRVFTADFTNYTPEGNTPLLVDTTITFEAGKYYTLLHTGYARTGSTPRQRIVVLEDNIPTPGASVAVRTLNAAPDLGSVDVYYSATPTTPSPVHRRSQGSRTLRLAVPHAGSRCVRALSRPPPAPRRRSGRSATAGAARNASANPTSGALIAGSALTAIAFPRSVAGSRAASFTTPGVVFSSTTARPHGPVTNSHALSRIAEWRCAQRDRVPCTRRPPA